MKDNDFTFGQELIVIADIYEQSSQMGEILACVGDRLIVDYVLDDPEESDFNVTASLKYLPNISPFVIRSNEVELAEINHD